MSPLEKQVVNLPMSGGLQEVAHEKLLDLPFMQTLQNCVYRKDGSISKRFGSSLAQTTGLPSTLDPNCLFDHNGALVQHTPHGTYAMSDDNARWRLVTPAATRATEIVSREITREGNTHHHDLAVLSNMVCYVYQQVEASDPGVWATVVELDTGAVVMVPTKLPSTLAHMPRVIAFDSTFVVAAHSSTTLPAPVYAIKIPVTTLPVAVSGGATRIDNSTDIARFDCHAEVADTFGQFAFSSSTNTYIAAYNKSLSLLDSDTLAKDSDTAIACYWNTIVAKFFVATRASATANVLVHSIAFAASTYGAPSLDVFDRAPADTDVNDPDFGLILGPLGSTGTMFMCSCTVELAAASRDQKRHIRSWNLTTTGAYAASSEFTITGYELATKMYRPTGWEYPVLGLVSVNFDSTPTGLLVVPYAVTYGSGQEALSVTNFAVVGRFHQEIITDHLAMGADIDVPLNPANVIRRMPSICYWSTDDKFVFAQTVNSQFLTANEGARFSDRTRKAGNRCIFSVAPQPLRQGKCNGLSIFDGGMPSAYDGLLSFETTPHQAPYVVQTVGAGTLDAGSYSYAYFFYFEDYNGNIHRGPVSYSDPVSVSGGDDKIIHTLVAWPLSALDGQHHRRMKLAIYRTENAGSIYYLVRDNISSLDAAYEDQTEDAALVLSPALYTTGDVLESGPPPSFLDMVVGNGRAFAVSGELPNQLWYTKPFEDSVAPEWEPNNTLRVPDEGGEIVALASLDDKIVVFKETAIFYFFGEGPNALGQDGSFSDVRDISIDVGCANKRAVVSGPFGVMFQAERGFYILGRDLSLKYIPNVEDSIEDIEVNSSVVVPDFHEVRFLADDGDCLSYNYLFDRWSTFTDYDGLHACMWGSIYSRLQEDYRVFIESSSVYTDDGVGYTQMVETPWIKIHGLQGFQRIWWAKVIGEHGAQSFQIEVGFNYDDDYPVTKTWTATQIDALERFQVGVHIPSGRQKCQAIRFRFTDFGTPVPPDNPHPTATGAGYTLAGLALEVGLKKDSFKHLPDGAKK